jgi:hypothetical protein
MRKRDLPDLIRSLGPVAYATLLEAYRPDCCIAAAAILTRVFAEYGYRAEPVSVSLEVYNAAMMKLLEKGVEIPPTSEPERRAMLFDLTGAWGVGVIPGLNRDLRGRPGYAGHLVLRVKQYLVDATIQQAQRPQKQIVLPALLATPHAEQLLRQGRVTLAVNGCAVRYARIDDQSYRVAPDWQRRSKPYPETVRKILARLEDQAGPNPV